MHPPIRPTGLISSDKKKKKARSLYPPGVNPNISIKKKEEEEKRFQFFNKKSRVEKIIDNI